MDDSIQGLYLRRIVLSYSLHAALPVSLAQENQDSLNGQICRGYSSCGPPETVSVVPSSFHLAVPALTECDQPTCRCDCICFFSSVPPLARFLLDGILPEPTPPITPASGFSIASNPCPPLSPSSTAGATVARSPCGIPVRRLQTEQTHCPNPAEVTFLPF